MFTHLNSFRISFSTALQESTGNVRQLIKRVRRWQIPVRDTSKDDTIQISALDLDPLCFGPPLDPYFICKVPNPAPDLEPSINKKKNLEEP
jgi:hypothetical protein